jgi:hypothetical protein
MGASSALAADGDGTHNTSFGIRLTRREADWLSRSDQKIRA